MRAHSSRVTQSHASNVLCAGISYRRPRRSACGSAGSVIQGDGTTEMSRMDDEDEDYEGACRTSAVPLRCQASSGGVACSDGIPLMGWTRRLTGTRGKHRHLGTGSFAHTCRRYKQNLKVSFCPGLPGFWTWYSTAQAWRRPSAVSTASLCYLPIFLLLLLFFNPVGVPTSCLAGFHIPSNQHADRTYSTGRRQKTVMLAFFQVFVA